jgi:gluconokinase
VRAYDSGHRMPANAPPRSSADLSTSVSQLPRPPIIVVMGVAGAGKTTIGQLLAQRLACALLEGDSLHSPENIRRMAAGIALTDEDRHDWLVAIAERIAAAAKSDEALVVTCSALKRRYREMLRGDVAHLVFVYLSGDKSLVESRVNERHDHFMPGSLVASQFAALEVPSADESVIYCDIALPPQAIVTSILEQLPSMMRRAMQSHAAH